MVFEKGKTVKFDQPDVMLQKETIFFRFVFLVSSGKKL